jgi:hypothetical protein
MCVNGRSREAKTSTAGCSNPSRPRSYALRHVRGLAHRPLFDAGAQCRAFQVGNQAWQRSIVNALKCRLRPIKNATKLRPSVCSLMCEMRLSQSIDGRQTFALRRCGDAAFRGGVIDRLRRPARAWPIPLFLFSEAREKFGEPLASNLGDGFEEAVAVLCAFAPRSSRHCNQPQQSWISAVGAGRSRGRATLFRARAGDH